LEEGETVLSEQNYYIGIESTASRTVVLVADQTGEVVGRGTSLASAYNLVGQERCSQILWSAIITAFSGAGINTRDLLRAELPLPDVNAVCIGMSGVERPKDEAQVRRIIADFNLTKNIKVTSEAQIALHAGIKASYGAAVVAGDNSLAVAINRNGQTAKAGGGGYLLGDEGSAHWLGFQAVKAILAALDGRAPQTDLLASIEQEWKVAPKPEAISGKFYGYLAGLGSGGNKAQLEETTETFKRQLSLLAPHVERLAAKGDAVSGEILDEAAEALSKAVKAAYGKVGFNTPTELTPTAPAIKSSRDLLMLFQQTGQTQPNSETGGKIPLAFTGNTLLSNKGELRQRLTALLPECDAPVLVTEPAEGALRLIRSQEIQ
jgi:N-acetylglucosamine kinase-like BadF-type ATPase